MVCSTVEWYILSSCSWGQEEYSEDSKRWVIAHTILQIYQMRYVSIETKRSEQAESGAQLCLLPAR